MFLEKGRSSRNHEVPGFSILEGPLGWWQMEFTHSYMPMESKLLKNNKRKQLLVPGGTERRKHWGTFLLYVEQEIIYKDKEAGRRWKKHCVGSQTQMEENKGQRNTMRRWVWVWCG